MNLSESYIRKIIREVLETALNKVNLQDLPEDMQELIFQLFGDRFGEEKHPPAQLPIKNMEVDKLPLLPLSVSDRGEEHVEHMIGEELPPIIISNGKLLDGRHRVHAAKREGRKLIQAIDLTSFGID